MDYYTENLADFGNREKGMAGELLMALSNGNLPDDFNDEGVKVAMNTSSGYVFLTNEDYQVAMMNGDKLESFYTCPICGHEGFLEDMAHGKDDKECQEYLKDITV